MQVSLNGEWVELPDAKLSAAMARWNFQGKCAVAVNGEFVPRAEYDNIELQDGDQIDVVAPVGGG